MEIEVESPEVEITNKNIVIESSNRNVAVEESTKELEVTVNRREYKIIGDGVFISSTYDNAPPWLKEFIDTTIEVAVVSRDQSLIDRMEAILTLMDYVPKNQYTEQINQIVSEDGIINSRIATLNSNLTGAINSTNATIAEINLTYASKDEAAAIAINALTASLSGSGEIGSALIQLQEAYADLESTTAQSISMLESVMEGEINGNATAMETIRTYVGIDEAGAGTGTGLSAYLEASDGTIGGADSQLANTIRVTAEGVESKFAYNSVVNINGIYKKSGFGLTTNYTSGSGTEANPYVSEFWIDASRLKFTNSAMTGRTAPFTIDASGTTPQVKFNGVVEFSNVSNVPSLGSNNMLVNAGPTLGNETYGWQIGWYNTNIAPTGPSAGFDSWRPTGGGSVYAVVGGSPTVGTLFDLKQSTNIPVVAGKRYEISALLSSHRCTSVCTLAFFNSSGTYISESGAGTANSVAYSGAVGNWVRQGGFVTAPAGTAYAQFYVRSTVTGTDPYCFVAQAYMAEASASSTQFSTWGEGLSANSVINWQSQVQAAINNNATTIDGGKIVTNTLYGNRLVANSVDATKISTYNLTSTNATFENGIITNAKIGDLSVSTLKIQDQAVTIPFSVLNWNTVNIGTSYSHVAAVGFVSTGAPITLTFSANLSAGSLRVVNARVVRDAVALYDAPTTSVGQSAGQYGNLIFVLMDTPGVGYHTYNLYLSTSVATTAASYISIIGMEVKK